MSNHRMHDKGKQGDHFLDLGITKLTKVTNKATVLLDNSEDKISSHDIAQIPAGATVEILSPLKGTFYSCIYRIGAHGTESEQSFSGYVAAADLI